MNNKLFIGNLPFSVTSESLSDEFSKCGTVQSSKVVTDRESGRSKGFAFVEMSTGEEAAAAVSQLNGMTMEGRAINVGEAKPQAPRDSGNGSGKNFGSRRR